MLERSNPQVTLMQKDAGLDHFASATLSSSEMSCGNVVSVTMDLNRTCALCCRECDQMLFTCVLQVTGCAYTDFINCL